MPKHLHKYKRQELGRKGYIVFKCVKAGCAHYIGSSLAEGRVCECNRCGERMVMDKRAIRLAKPYCDDCAGKKKKVSKLEQMFT